MVKTNIAVIPARGGSKRIPHKNIVEFCGKPLLAWTIEAAQQAEIFSRIIVSTDDPSIAAVAEQYGVETPFLRDDYSDDHASVAEATVAAVKQASEFFSEQYEIVAQLMPNCPLRKADHIVEAMAGFKKSGAPFQISCFKYGWMNPWWAVALDENRRPKPLFPNEITQRSQDLPPLYCPSGAIWLAQWKMLRITKEFYEADVVFQPMDWKAAIDIDDYEDLAMAQALRMSSEKNS